MGPWRELFRLCGVSATVRCVSPRKYCSRPSSSEAMTTRRAPAALRKTSKLCRPCRAPERPHSEGPRREGEGGLSCFGFVIIVECFMWCIDLHASSCSDRSPGVRRSYPTAAADCRSPEVERGSANSCAANSVQGKSGSSRSNQACQEPKALTLASFIQRAPLASDSRNCDSKPSCRSACRKP